MPRSFQYLMKVQDIRRLKYKVKRFTIYINPTIIWKSEEEMFENEYCFSVDDFEYKVKRPA
jgi:peptide deformylase